MSDEGGSDTSTPNAFELSEIDAATTSGANDALLQAQGDGATAVSGLATTENAGGTDTAAKREKRKNDAAFQRLVAEQTLTIQQKYTAAKRMLNDIIKMIKLLPDFLREKGETLAQGYKDALKSSFDGYNDANEFVTDMLAEQEQLLARLDPNAQTTLETLMELGATMVSIKIAVPGEDNYDRPDFERFHVVYKEDDRYFVRHPQNGTKLYVDEIITDEEEYAAVKKDIEHQAEEGELFGNGNTDMVTAYNDAYTAWFNICRDRDLWDVRDDIVASVVAISKAQQCSKELLEQYQKVINDIDSFRELLEKGQMTEAEFDRRLEDLERRTQDITSQLDTIADTRIKAATDFRDIAYTQAALRGVASEYPDRELRIQERYGDDIHSAPIVEYNGLPVSRENSGRLFVNSPETGEKEYLNDTAVVIELYVKANFGDNFSIFYNEHYMENPYQRGFARPDGPSHGTNLPTLEDYEREYGTPHAEVPAEEKDGMISGQAPAARNENAGALSKTFGVFSDVLTTASEASKALEAAKTEPKESEEPTEQSENNNTNQGLGGGAGFTGV